MFFKNTELTDNKSFVIFYDTGKEIKPNFIKQWAFSRIVTTHDRAFSTELEADEYAMESISRNVGVFSRAPQIFEKFLKTKEPDDLTENAYWIMEMKGDVPTITTLLKKEEQDKFCSLILSIRNNGRTVLLTKKESNEVLLFENVQLEKPEGKPRNPREYRQAQNSFGS